jgi:hypothetical protein
MKMRRFAAVLCKPLKMLMRRFDAAVLRWFAAVQKSLTKSVCGGSAVDAVRHSPYPYTRFAAPLRGAAGAWSTGADDVTAGWSRMMALRAQTISKKISRVPRVLFREKT